MSSAIANLQTWTFVVGVAAGFTLSRLWSAFKVWRLDRAHPLPGGRRRSWWKAAAVDPRYIAALTALGFLWWSVAQTQANTNEAHRITMEARTFAVATRHCQQELITAIRSSRKVSEENDAESESQRDAIADWLRELLNPPPDIARLDGTDPVRQRWAIDTTEQYFAVIEASQDRQRQNEAHRAPLPEPDCGG